MNYEKPSGNTKTTGGFQASPFGGCYIKYFIYKGEIIMCGFNLGNGNNNCCWIIIILLIVLYCCCCHQNNNNGCSCGCDDNNNNNSGCGCIC